MTQPNSDDSPTSWHRRLSRRWHHRPTSPTDDLSPKSPSPEPPTGSGTPDPGESAYYPHAGPRRTHAHSLSPGLMHTMNMFTRPASPVSAQNSQMVSDKYHTDLRENPSPASAPANAMGIGQFADAWAQVKVQHEIMEKVARELFPDLFEPPAPPGTTKSKPGPDHQSGLIRPASRLEQLPDELLMQIMGYLADPDLYRLSQASPLCLRLSFDDVFEADPRWRTFRTIMDVTGGGPRARGSRGM